MLPANLARHSQIAVYLTSILLFIWTLKYLHFLPTLSAGSWTNSASTTPRFTLPPGNITSEIRVTDPDTKANTTLWVLDLHYVYVQNADTGAFGSEFRIQDKGKVAVIVEGRYLPNLPPLISHFSSVLGPEWPIVVYTMPANLGNYTSSAPMLRKLLDGSMQLRVLPYDLNTSDEVSRLWASPLIYASTSPAEHLLTFQSDSMLCANSPHRAEDFLDYDFVGGPIASILGAGVNGGLSLRKRRSFLKIAELGGWDRIPSIFERIEDRWFWERLSNISDSQVATGVQWSGDPGQTDKLGFERIRLPKQEESMKFAVETIWYEKPLGVHQVGRWWKGEGLEKMIKHMDGYCPEWRMCHKALVNRTTVKEVDNSAPVGKPKPLEGGNLGFKAGDKGDKEAGNKGKGMGKMEEEADLPA
jgi:hypothetical protein